MPRFVRKLAILAKIETTYGVDAVPTGVANAILGLNVTFTPIAGGEERRDLILPYLGHQGVLLSDEHAIIEFSVEINGAGAAGTAPAYGPLLRASGLAEVISAGVSAAYSPVSAAFEAVTLYYNLDGVRHVLLGARGTVSLEMTAQRIPRLRFRLLGLKGTITDAALPAATLTAFKKPVIVCKANTTFSIHGYAGPMETFTLDLGNQVVPRLLVNAESIEISDRQATGSATVEAPLLATKDFFAIASNRTRGALSAVHGVGAGNIFEVTAAAVELGRPSQGERDGIANYTLPMMLCPTNGNDEVTFTVR